MANTGAIAAWQTVRTGRGITVGVVDSGIKLNHQDLGVNISSLSTDIVAGRNQPQGSDTHGTRVSSVIAAPFNGFGTVGVAFNATILSIRADISECNDPDNAVCFRGSDLANALDYAVANGAKVINLSLGGEGPLGGAFEAALQRAIDAGVVFAIASGNEAWANPEWPGRYASDPRFAGGIIVTGAHDFRQSDGRASPTARACRSPGSCPRRASASSSIARTPVAGASAAPPSPPPPWRALWPCCWRPSPI